METTNVVDAYRFVDSNFNQTDLVSHLLEEKVIDATNLEGNNENKDIY